MGKQVLPIVKTRRKKSIGIKSNANVLELHVPQHLSDRALRKILDDHVEWIARRVKGFQASFCSLFKFKTGDPVHFKGERYVFELLQSDQVNKPEFELVNGQFLAVVPAKKWQSFPSIDAQQAWLKSVLQKWFKQQAQAYFEAKTAIYATQIGVMASAIQVKAYKARWGSCYPDGKIQFNWRLMQMPSWVIDYVVVHELCHLKHPNHSPAFWNQVEKHYPQTQMAKKWLKENQAPLIHFLS